MIRSELVKKLEAENPGMTGEEVERIVDLFFNQIVSNVYYQIITSDEVLD